MRQFSDSLSGSLLSVLPLLKNKNSLFQNNLICPFASSSFRWNSHFLHPFTKHVIIKLKKQEEKITWKCLLNLLFTSDSTLAAWHLLTKPWYDVIWAVIIISNRWLVFSLIPLSSVCVFWGHISMYCCKVIQCMSFSQWVVGEFVYFSRH